MTDPRPYAALGAATVLWGAATSVTKYAVDQLGGVTAVTVEVVAAAVPLSVILLVTGRFRRPPGVALRWYVLLALLEPAISLGLPALGLERTHAADAALLTGALPGMVLALGAIFLRQPVRGRALAGVIMVSGGAVLLAGGQVSLSAGLGDGLVLLGCVAGAATVIVVNRLVGRTGAVRLTAYQFGLGALLLLPLTGFGWLTGVERPPLTAGQLPAVAAAAGVGVVSLAGGYLAYNFAVGRVPVGLAGMALNLVPLSGVLTAVLLLHERLSAAVVLGGALILGGLALFPYQNIEQPTEVTP